MIVTREYGLTESAVRALKPSLAVSNFGWQEILDVLNGYGWAIWNIGDISWVVTMINMDGEIEVLLAGGKDPKKCLPLWEAAMLEEPDHKGLTLRVESRKGWQRLLPHWERRDDVLYLRISAGE